MNLNGCAAHESGTNWFYFSCDLDPKWIQSDTKCSPVQTHIENGFSQNNFEICFFFSFPFSLSLAHSLAHSLSPYMDLLVFAEDWT